MKRTNPFLFIIIALAAVLRLYKLGSIPLGLNLDEVLYGLDGYSLIHTAKDIYGRFLPLTFQSSGYYPPLYPYILAGFFSFLPLEPWVVRLPAAVAGSLTVMLTYFLAIELFPDKKLSPLPYLAALLLALSPWHIHLSRVAFLGSFGLIFLTGGTLLCLKAINKPHLLIPGTLLLALSTYAHYGYKLFAPSLFISIVIASKLWRSPPLRLRWGLVMFIWVMAALGQVYAIRYGNANFRVNELVTQPVNQVVTQYFQAFSPQFLFVTGDHYRLINPWDRGVLPSVFILLLLIGLWRWPSYSLKAKVFLSFWIIITPIPGAVAGLGAHAVRLSPLLIPLTLIAAAGLTQAIKFNVHLGLIVGAVVILQSLSYVLVYPGTFAHDSDKFWGQTITAAINQGIVQAQDQPVVFLDAYNSTLAYFAFITRLHPSLLQQALLHPTNLHDLPAKQVDNFYFIATEEINDPKWINQLPQSILTINPHSN